MSIEEMKNNKRALDFFRLRIECKKNSDEYGNGMNHRISRDGNIISRLDCGGGFYRVTIMGQCADRPSTDRDWRELNDFAFAKAQRENTPTPSEDTDKKATPRIDKWDKDRCKRAEEWAEKFSHKKLVYTLWNSSKDGGTQSFVSVKDGMLHFDLITRYPDYDIPEDGMNEIYAVLEKAHAEIDAIVKARLEYWREEERNGRL